MAKEALAEYKTLLTKDEYLNIFNNINTDNGNLQTNYYFDTKRFTLKASEAALRVKKRDNLVLTLERKKGYQLIRYDEDITEQEFNELLSTGKVENQKIQADLLDIIKDQPVINFLTLSTYRITFPFKKGKVALDKCEYCGTTDYELEYTGANRELAKLEFIELIKLYNIAYKKSQLKLKRAFEEFKKRR